LSDKINQDSGIINMIRKIDKKFEIVKTRCVIKSSLIFILLS